jgi:hypothetical protein
MTELVDRLTHPAVQLRHLGIVPVVDLRSVRELSPCELFSHPVAEAISACIGCWHGSHTQVWRTHGNHDGQQNRRQQHLKDGERPPSGQRVSPHAIH